MIYVIITSSQESSSREIEMEFENLWPRVTALCQRVAELKCRTAKDKLARAGKSVMYNWMRNKTWGSQGV